MDSTKKVTKKLAGAAAGTAAWCTNVGNEHGQVLVSVLTAAEGHGLHPMAAGLMKRYREAGEAAPKVMYVDRDCCSLHGKSQVKVMFSEWDELKVRLDIWHFMRRFAAGVTTEAHPLYGTFMARLSMCIFQWDSDDVAALHRAKEGELAAKKAGHISGKALSSRITRRELALHCRRRTRGVEETTRLIGSLVDLFDSASGKDTLGVPLLDHERIQQIWKEQRKHVQCIQDPENFPLYMKTGTLKKGSVELCCYRCARGSTSLESFHLHLNHFIPGTSASDSHFQAYLLEGLMRWNDDRMEDAIKGASSIRTYGSAMKEAVDKLSRTVFGKPWDERYRPPGAYTGELLGMEYLYSQTGKTLTPVLQNPEEEDRLVEEVDDQDLQDEGFEEEIMEDITVPVLYEDDPCRDLENSPSSLPLHQSPASMADVSLAEPSTSSSPGGEQQHLAPAPSVLSQSSDTGSSISDEAQGAVIGPDGIAGWDKVQDLAGYLVGLREAPYLTDQQVTEAIQLWTALLDFDKQRINYQPRHQPQLTQGRYKAPKRSGVTPGVESVKRCLIGHPGGPAQWPDANRLVNTICMKLCALHKSPTKKDGVCTPRWSKVLSDYHHIRELVLNNPTLMDETTIQLFEINHRTLTQWFRKWKNRQEMGVLGQGLTPSNPIAVADTHLPPPREKLNEVPSTSGPKHQFFLPPNREGQAPLLRPGRKPAAATREFPIASAPTASGVVQPIAPAPTASGVMQHILAPIAPAPTASGVVQPILAPIAPAPTASGVMQHILAPIAPAPTASGVVQHILAPGLSFGTVVFNPDMTVSVVIPPSGASTSSAVPAPPACAKMYAYPVFQPQSATSSRLLMAPSAEAKHLEKLESGRAKSKEEVLAEARAFVSTNGGDPSDQFFVLAHCKLQFGKYQGQRFRWLLENSLGSSEKAHPTPLSENKQLYLENTSLIREMAEEAEKYKRKQEMQAEAHATGDQGCLMVEFGDFQGRSMKDVYEDQSKQSQALIRYLVKANPNPNTNNTESCSDCGKHKLTAAGLYRTVRKVLDIDSWYDLATEYLECKKKYPAWSEDILGQLDMGHRSQFPALLTYRYSCDNRVLRMMRERTQGNSVTQLYKKLMEKHSEAWTQRVLQYLTACEPFTRSSLVQPPVFAEPTSLPALPKPKWLLAVYTRDVLG
nr:uncharacterized protein LOC129454565 [Misgurnus anguillicaudatus]